MRNVITIMLLLVFTAILMPQEKATRPVKVAENFKMIKTLPLTELAKNKVNRVKGWKDNIVPNKKKPPLRMFNKKNIIEEIVDPGLQTKQGFRQPTGTYASFDGINNVDGYSPPDENGAVSANYYVQSVNSSYAVYNKAGTKLLGPLDLGVIWQALPGPWSTSLNDGDPIVLYDRVADRWLVSEFSLPNYPNGPFYELVAISTTNNPTGSYYAYAFEFDKMPDYPHLGVWPDGYYLSVNLYAKSPTSNDMSWAGTQVCVLERDAMIAGTSARMISFGFTDNDPVYGFLPSDFDGTVPPAGTPNYFCCIYDNNWGIPYDVIRVYQFRTNWASPTASTFTLSNDLSVNPFSTSSTTISQPGVSYPLDEINDRLMHRLQYRKFADHESMVANHTINNSGKAAIRWYELRKTTGSWSVYQQGTYAPDANNRWMASIAMDDEGNIGLGYSVSSSTVYPSIRYTGRLKNDPLGQMTVAEATILAGTGSQNASHGRWGDYTSLSIDPSDGTTFWYTNEYFTTTSSSSWKTRIASFKLSSTQTGPCLAADPTIVNATSGAGTYDVTVSTTCGGTLDWTAATTADWITLNTVNMNKLQILTAANNNPQSRNATVTITQAGATNSPLVITVNQAGANSTNSISGRVKDALSNAYLAGVTVSAGGKTTTTDNEGRYALLDLPLGVVNASFSGSPTSGTAPLTVQFTDLSNDNFLTLSAALSGYITYSNNQVTLQSGEAKIIDIALSPVLSGDGMRFVLSWGEYPWDLDSHLKTPNINGIPYHVSYIEPGDSLSAPFATLDVDNTDGYGPETITIHQFFTGTYNYYVHNYSGQDIADTSLKNSNATVQIYTKDGLKATIKCPNVGEGYYWHVCDVNGATKEVTIVNTIVAVDPGPPILAKVSDSKKNKIYPKHNAPQNVNTINSWLWEFGDLTTSTLQNPSHIYQDAGTYTVKLTVSNTASQKTETKENYIVVSPPVTVNKTISGTVTLANQSPLTGVRLTYAGSGINDFVTSGADGSYSFNIPSGWNGIVTPSKEGYSFVPTERNYTNVTADASAQNYVGTLSTALPAITAVVPPNVNTGTEFWADITVGSNTPVNNLFGVSFELNYAKAYLTYVSAEPGSFLGNAADLIFFATNDAGSGKVSIGVSRKSPAIGVSGTLVVVRVKFSVSSSAPNASTADFTLSGVSAVDPTGLAINLTPVSSSTLIISGVLVWPGDTNNDGLVNQTDVLPIGLQWAKTGTARANASSNWVGQSCTPWNPVAATYADANGDGVVNQADVMPIGINWNKIHSVLNPDRAIAYSQSILKTGAVTRNDKEININLLLENKDGDLKNVSGIALSADYSSSIKTEDLQISAAGYFNGTMVNYSNSDKGLKKTFFGTSLIQKQSANSENNPIITIKLKQSDLKGAANILLSDITLINEEGVYFNLKDLNINLSITAMLDKETVNSYSLIQNFPNPFNPSTLIEYTLPNASNVMLKVYNALGQEIQTLVNEYKQAGKHRVEFNAANLPSGVYIYRITTGNFTELKKMILQK